jgi:hypothetical protein
MNNDNDGNLDVAKYLFEVETHVNADGSLGVIDFAKGELPFTPQRVFFIYGVGNDSTRGKHAHKECKQLFIQLAGSSNLKFVNRLGEGVHRFDNPSEAFFAEKLTWCEFSDFSEGSVLMVLTSDSYDAGDYIHDLDEFYSHIGSIK